MRRRSASIARGQGPRPRAGRWFRPGFWGWLVTRTGEPWGVHALWGRTATRASTRVQKIERQSEA